MSEAKNGHTLHRRRARGNPPIASWKDEPNLPDRAPSARWANFFLLVLTIIAITALSGIGLSQLYHENIQPSSNERPGSDAGSDPRLQALLRAHRDAVLLRPHGANRSDP